MPLALIGLVWGGAVLLGGAGTMMAGKALDEVSNAAGKMTLAGLAAGGGYLYLKKRGVL